MCVRFIGLRSPQATAQNSPTSVPPFGILCAAFLMTAITIKNLTKYFGSTAAVNGVDLTINSGELFFLLGPSGCGKTTLLRMIAGFIEPSAGSISFGDHDVTHLPPNKRNAGMVFQSYALWPHMTVADNVAYGLEVRKTPAAEKQERVEAALRSVRMEEYASRKPNQLSGGQQQRVALARALVIKPTVLLLDEPLSNLDAKLRLEMRSEIRRLCSETRITTVYVTHDQKEALSMADNMAVLDRGKVKQLGEPRRMYERPNSRFVAEFLGETNFLAATVEGEEDGCVMLQTAAGGLRSKLLRRAAGSRFVDVSIPPAAPAAQASLDIPPTFRPPSGSGGNVTCSIRPEAFTMISQSSDSVGYNILQGKRLYTVYLGEVAQHMVELRDGTVVRVLELNPEDSGVSGDAVMLAVKTEDVVILAD